MAVLLSKNDPRFLVFQWTHKVMAYTLLAMIVLHVAGVVKHHWFDRQARKRRPSAHAVDPARSATSKI